MICLLGRIPNNTNALASGSAYYSNKKMANISVKLSII